MADALRIQPVSGGVRISVRLQPRASRNEVVGVVGDALKVRVTAPPVDGAANEKLVEVLAATFGLPTRCIAIVAGPASRSKVVELAGASADDVRRVVARFG